MHTCTQYCTHTPMIHTMIRISYTHKSLAQDVLWKYAIACFSIYLSLVFIYLLFQFILIYIFIFICYIHQNHIYSLSSGKCLLLTTIVFRFCDRGRMEAWQAEGPWFDPQLLQKNRKWYVYPNHCETCSAQSNMFLTVTRCSAPFRTSWNSHCNWFQNLVFCHVTDHAIAYYSRWW